MTFHDGISSEASLPFASIKYLVLRFSAGEYWRTLRDSITDQVWVDALGRRGAVEIFLVFTGVTAITRV